MSSLNVQDLNPRTTSRTRLIEEPAARPDPQPRQAGESDPDPAPAPAPGEDADEQAVQRIKELPREVGVMLVSVGVLGFVLPGVMGAPAMIAGGLVLWPKAFNKVEGWFERRYPGVHRRGMQQVGRFLDDMERRFPNTTE